MSEINHSPDTADASNVVKLTDSIIEEGSKSAQELERKRTIIVRALQITVQQLEQDALKLEESAIVGNYDIQKRHAMMDQARSLRSTCGWITGMHNQPAT